MLPQPHFSFFFFFNDTATTEIYTLSLHDALPIFSIYKTVQQAIKQLDNRIHLALSDVRAVSPDSNRSEEHTSELQSPCNLVCRLLLEKKKIIAKPYTQCRFQIADASRSESSR